MINILEYNFCLFLPYFLLQMKLHQKHICPILIFFTILLQSCVTSIKDAQPQFKKPVEAISIDISSLVSYKDFKITSHVKNSLNTQPSRDLTVELKDPKILTYTTADLEKLSKNISMLIKKNMLNLDSYDWLTITYVTSDGSSVSDSTTINAYVFRPHDIK